ncbi:CLUMA_CG016595, isoform A [Clunio marinus]|uniref:CLUMA_CG016595, isoform A n=1 Tax=Clunio marinus TaxID=568069 RepID=A0A1J1IU99_9DIPT|nr:CLUMA_CG016595, isoform A [Clunio marinus]
MWLGPKFMVWISSPEKIQKVLSSQKCLEKWNFFYRLMERDYGLISGRYETWANALAHGMLLLAMHPEVQEQLYHEIKTNIKSQEELKNSQNVNNLSYLDMVFKEILRLLPTVPMILRETLEDFEIEPGVVIPKETNILIHFYSLHRHKHIWGEDADEFKPERFQPELVAKRHQFSFLPFSSGSRICIGYKYSIISLKIAIILLLQRFKFNTSMAMKDIRLRSYISLKLCTPHLLSIEKRN